MSAGACIRVVDVPNCDVVDEDTINDDEPECLVCDTGYWLEEDTG